jgi:anaerobic magnesium-protoporphyrin IX monomethyl ester cyclase
VHFKLGKKMKTKILLVSPIFSEEEASGNTKSMKKVMNVIPPLGLAYIAAYLEKNGFYVRIVDCSVGIDYTQLAKILKKENPDIVGMTGTTPSLQSIIETAKLIRKTLPGALLIIGGPHATAMPKETIETNLFDLGVLGEGEPSFLEIAHIFEKKGKLTTNYLKKIKGIVFMDKNKVVITAPGEFIKDLDSIPFPARHLLPPPSNYHPTPASYRRLPQAHVMTARGCPYQCTFCDRKIFGSTYRERSVDNVMKEIDELMEKYGVKDIKFFDDTFTLNRKRLLRMCTELKKRKLKWCCLTRVNVVDYDLLRTMKKSGCYQVLFGIESGDNRMLKLLKKGTTVKQNARAIRLAKKAGLNVRCDFIVGTPGETMQSMKKTVDFAIKENPDFAHFNKFTPYPGTEIYQRLKEEGFNFDFTKFHSQLDHTIIMYTPSGVDKKEYKKFLDDSFKRFYLRPRYITRQISQIRSLQDVKRLWDGFFAIFEL